MYIIKINLKYFQITLLVTNMLKNTIDPKTFLKVIIYPYILVGED